MNLSCKIFLSIFFFFFLGFLIFQIREKSSCVKNTTNGVKIGEEARSRMEGGKKYTKLERLCVGKLKLRESIYSVEYK